MVFIGLVLVAVIGVPLVTALLCILEILAGVLDGRERALLFLLDALGFGVESVGVLLDAVVSDQVDVLAVDLDRDDTLTAVDVDNRLSGLDSLLGALLEAFLDVVPGAILRASVLDRREDVVDQSVLGVQRLGLLAEIVCFLFEATDRALLLFDDPLVLGDLLLEIGLLFCWVGFGLVLEFEPGSIPASSSFVRTELNVSASVSRSASGVSASASATWVQRSVSSSKSAGSSSS